MAPRASTLRVIPRSSWTKAAPKRTETVAMGRIDRITVHHEGWTAVNFADTGSTARRLEHIRLVHTRDNHWADIGYHYVVDRAGRIWACRPLGYQGAHVRDQNEHNLGVMCLGNFDRQTPTGAQLAGLQRLLVDYRRRLRIPAASIYTHLEINPTRCPGSALQRRMENLRRGRSLI